MNTDNRVFVDIETIPSAAMPPVEEIKVPGNYSKPEAILKYQKENQIDIWKKQALDSMRGQIICIGYAHEGITKSILMDNEKDTVELFYFRIKEISDSIKEIIHFVGWNITSFDIPWLWRKAIQHDLRDLRKMIPHGNRLLQTDLMKVFASDFKDYVSLDNCAKFLNITHEGGKGSDVFDWWQTGNVEAIRGHCESDVRTAMDIYERING